MCVCVCVHACVYVCVHARVCMRAHVCVSVFVCVCVCVCVQLVPRGCDSRMSLHLRSKRHDRFVNTSQGTWTTRLVTAWHWNTINNESF